jgi:hypothetical protein
MIKKDSEKKLVITFYKQIIYSYLDMEDFKTNQQKISSANYGFMP